MRFTRDVLGDPDRAAEIEDENLDDYAERRKIILMNPNKRRHHMAIGRTKAELEACKRLGVPVRDYLLAVSPGMGQRRLPEVASLTPARWASR